MSFKIDTLGNSLLPHLRAAAATIGVEIETPMTGATPWFTYASFQGREHPFPILVAAGSAVVYLLLVYVVWPAMKPASARAVAATKALRFWHNVGLCAFSFFSCAVTLTYLIQDGQITLSGVTRAYMCKAAPAWLQYVHALFIVSKIYEWLDTLFLVWLSPRALSFLHVYHHATTFWLFLTGPLLPGSTKNGLVLNGGVHTLMYAHYAWPFPKPLVPLITVCQIIQLAYASYTWTVTPSHCPEEFGSFPSDLPLEFVTPYAMVPVYLVFFINFFVGRFFRGNSRRPRGTKKEE